MAKIFGPAAALAIVLPAIYAALITPINWWIAAIFFVVGIVIGFRIGLRIVNGEWVTSRYIAVPPEKRRRSQP